MRIFAFIISLSLLSLLFAAGCDEITYPKEKLRESVIKLCNEEYAIDVDVAIVGKTLAIYLPLANLFDLTLSLSEKAQDKVQNVLMGASRIALSTDADIEFYCIITQDVRIPEIQFVIIKYVNDIKRAFYNDISRGEYFKRTLIDINENPQAKKERAIRDVFDKMNLEEEWQSKILDDFFRSPPSSLEGIGYWHENFYVKDITFEEFLAQQIASRAKVGFREKGLLEKHSLKSITGKFITKGKLRFFLISFNAESLLFVIDPKEKLSMEKEIFTSIVEKISHIIYGYKFKNFDLAEIIDKSTNTKLLLSKEEIYLFKQKNLPMETILGGINQL